MKNLKTQIIRMAQVSGEGHIASSFSILDILQVLYKKILVPDRDHFILSKGHASMGLYATLADCGLIPQEELMTFCQHDSRLGGHPVRGKQPTVEASSGSRGTGYLWQSALHSV
jgi:transketolase